MFIQMYVNSGLFISFAEELLNSFLHLPGPGGYSQVLRKDLKKLLLKRVGNRDAFPVSISSCN